MVPQAPHQMGVPHGTLPLLNICFSYICYAYACVSVILSQFKGDSSQRWIFGPRIRGKT